MIKGLLRHAISACVYRIAARFQRLKTQHNAVSVVRNISIEIVPHCGKSKILGFGSISCWSNDSF
jgi:hypothetical protein